MKRTRRDSGKIANPVQDTPDVRRRRMLQGMLSGSVLALAGRDTGAQSRGLGPAAAALAAAPQSRGTVLALPRHALVIGNSKYKEAPLRNPVNDAEAIAAVLKRSAFQVTQFLDAGRAAMIDAIQDFGSRVQQQGAVGLFYFAGHGVQLAWRNYLIPVDAVVDNPDDVRTRTVELNSLLQALTQAKNPMNVIILDACRDNPFGVRVASGQKGLSQFDAPPGSLLAYATAPGNVASDGDGANGIYTENLLREMQVPDAKIEDVFKRVRLHVRRRTNGQQIPWESTSLEEDFYFLTPRALEEEARAQEREMALREKERAEAETELKRRQEQALREARQAAEEAERQRQLELAALEKRRIAEEAERIRNRELALKEAQRVVEETERRRREEQAVLEAKRAQEEAERRRQQELAALEERRKQDEAERRRREEQVVLDAKRAQEQTERKHQQEAAQRAQQRAQEDAARPKQEKTVVSRKPDPHRANQLFEEELAIWEKIQTSSDSKSLEAYLLRYPSGRFSELAQLQLDRILAAQGEKRIEIVSAPENPFTKGTAVAGTRYRVGDSYTYRVSDLYTKLVTETYTQTITKITDREVFDDSGTITDLLGNRIRHRDGRRFGPSQFLPLEYSVGKRWTSRFKITTSRGEGQVELDVRIVAREIITVPAGTFDAFRLEGRGWSTGPWGNTQIAVIRWLAPDRVRRAIATEDTRMAMGGQRIIAAEREELVAFREA